MKVLFVCTGNICRSPTAEAVARTLAAEQGLAGHLTFDSAGLESYHVGDPPDPRAIARGRVRGYDLTPLRARRVRAADYTDFDLILAMDATHYRAVVRQCPPAYREKIRMLLADGEAATGPDVPDPYYGDEHDFDDVLDLCERGLAPLLTTWRESFRTPKT
jgi:protein-tyrosine phosphatase